MRNNRKLAFCNNVSYLRKVHRLSRTAMARIMGITVKTLDSIEQGIVPSRTSIKVLYKLYIYFGITPDVLLEPLNGYKPVILHFNENKREGQ